MVNPGSPSARLRATNAAAWASVTTVRQRMARAALIVLVRETLVRSRRSSRWRPTVGCQDPVDPAPEPRRRLHAGAQAADPLGQPPVRGHDPPAGQVGVTGDHGDD